MPCWMASSKLVSEIALISVTVATLILLESPLFRMFAHYYCLHFAYHLKGEAKHIGGRPLNTHRKRPIAPVLHLALIHSSAWNRNSANFTFWGFSEVRPGSSAS